MPPYLCDKRAYLEEVQSQVIVRVVKMFYDLKSNIFMNLKKIKSDKQSAGVFWKKIKIIFWPWKHKKNHPKKLHTYASQEVFFSAARLPKTAQNFIFVL